jgi:hypothetical protein
MKNLRWLVLPVPRALACGSASPYEAEYDCTQTLSCFEEEEGFVLGPTSVDDCTARSQSDYDGLTHPQSADAWFSACQDAMGCDYVDCKAEQNSVDRAFLVRMAEQYDTRQPCEDGVISKPGQLESPQGTIPYDSIVVSLAHNTSYDCLSMVTVSFEMGECSLTLNATDYSSTEGGYLIEWIEFSKLGTCPGWEWLGDSYGETAEGVPLGTIDVDRPLDPWDECVQGQLVISLDVVLSGIPGTSPDVDLSDVWLPVSGYYSATSTSAAACAL